MGKSTQSANDVLNKILRNVDPSWENAGTLYLSLHTAAVAVGDPQNTNEAAYTGYARVALTRSSGGAWSAASNRQSQNNSQIQFGIATGGTLPETETYVAIGENSSGSGTILYSGALSQALVVNINIRPQFDPATLTVTEA